MPYEKQNFVNGEVLTAEQLNHMEDGIAKAMESGGVSDYNDLENKPEFKTINGQEIVGEGNIEVTGGASSWNDLTDKPFGEEVKKVYGSHNGSWFQETDTTFVSNGIVRANFPLVVGEFYTVVFNGNAIPNCECVEKQRVDNSIVPSLSVVIDDKIRLIVEYLSETQVGSLLFITIYDHNITEYDYEYEASVEVIGIDKETTFTKLDGKYLPDGVPYTESSGGMVEILPETEAVYDEDMGYVLHGFLSNIVAGQTYVVNYNGTDYECNALDLSFVQPGLIGLGDLYTLTNGGMGESATGEPFAIMYAEMDGTAMGAITPLVEVTSITVSIYQGGSETVHKLDNKYLDLEWLPVTNKKETLFASEQTVTKGNINDGFDVGFAVSEMPNKLVVYWDGVRYETKITTIGEGSDRQDYAGNGAIVAPGLPDTGEPFFMGILQSAISVNYLGEGSHVASIYLLEEEPNKIPAKFLPDNIGNELETISFTYGYNGITCNHSPSKLFEMLSVSQKHNYELTIETTGAYSNLALPVSSLLGSDLLNAFYIVFYTPTDLNPTSGKVTIGNLTVKCTETEFSIIM
jgi:hypothetical protein